MKKLGLLSIIMSMVACGSDPTASTIQEVACDAGALEDVSLPPAPVPRNNDNTDGGLCCQITNNFTDSPRWNNGFYTCVLTGEVLNPYNPPWICNTTFDGKCGHDGEPDCLTCFDPICVVGMRCLDVNGTGSVIPCN